ncbi:MAG: archaeosine biosynthesis radical SAM protein RaSEA [Methanomicrobiales archaeon]|nr:archaeosine biosynthesis radical SAM protein RaSEA [Methanomicrobiales archaeon]
MVPVADEKPLACWTGKDRIGAEALPSLTVIFRSGGCAWNRCLMCGYRSVRIDGQPGQLATRILAQLSWIRSHHDPASYDLVKIYTSGSFLDSCEVPPAARDAVGDAFRGKVVIAETRPEFVTPEVLDDFIARVDDGSRAVPLYTAIGLETTDDGIREKCIRKGFTFADYLGAARIARDAGAGVKAYLLQKPPFLTEREAAEDMSRSLAALAGHADLVSLNPCTVQSGTTVEWLWQRGAYRPPYLWSVLRVLEGAPMHVTCDPVGGGYPRGPHNCGRCDRELLAGIRDHSLSGDRALLRALLGQECSCRAEWDLVMERERPYAMPLTR